MNAINKPLDRFAKDFLDQALRLFLHIMGVLDIGADAVVEVLSPETAPPVKIPDFVARILMAGGDPFVFHVEFEASWHPRIPPLMARRGASLAWQHEVPVQSLLVLIQPEGCPAELPEVGEFAIGKTVTTHPFRSVRMWNLDPDLLLKSGNPKVAVWALLMNSVDDEVRGLAKQIVATGDEDLLARLVTLASFRYHKEEFERLMTGVRNMAFAEMIERSWFWQDVTRDATEKGLARGMAQGMEQGMAQGRTVGQAEGKVDEARNLLRAGLAAKYPGLESIAEIDRITDVALLEKLLIEYVVKSDDRRRAELAIHAGASSEHP